MDVSGSAFKNKFVQNPKGYSDRFSDYDREVLAKVENLRESVIEPLLFSKKMQRIKTDLKFQSCSMPFLKNLKFPMRYAECMRNLNARTINRWVRSR